MSCFSSSLVQVKRRFLFNDGVLFPKAIFGRYRNLHFSGSTFFFETNVGISFNNKPEIINRITSVPIWVEEFVAFFTHFTEETKNPRLFANLIISSAKLNLF